MRHFNTCNICNTPLVCHFNETSSSFSPQCNIWQCLAVLRCCSEIVNDEDFCYLKKYIFINKHIAKLQTFSFSVANFCLVTPISF